MVWLRIDDSFGEHPKIQELSADAFRLHVRAMCHAAKYLTDGFISSGTAKRMDPKYLTSTRELVAQKLWERCAGGYRIHDWLNYNPSRLDVESIRKSKAEAGRLGGLARSRNLAPAKHDADYVPNPRPVPIPEGYASPQSGGNGGRLGGLRPISDGIRRLDGAR